MITYLDHLDHFDLTIAFFYLSLILTWFIMKGVLLVMQPLGSGNNISVKIWKTDTKLEFRNKLKTHMFKSYYNY